MPGTAAIDPGLGSPDVYAVGLLFVGLAVLVAILALSHQRAGAYSASIVYLAMGALGRPAWRCSTPRGSG
jgi:hypothetical protein